MFRNRLVKWGAILVSSMFAVVPGCDGITQTLTDLLNSIVPAGVA